MVNKTTHKCKRLLLFIALFISVFLFSLPIHASNTEAMDGSEIDNSAKKSSRPLTVAVASNFRYTLEQVIALSEYWSSQDVRIVSASSGTLYAQIIKGAPFDVYLSADMQRPEALVKAGFGLKTHIYSIGRLVLWPAPKNDNEYFDMMALIQYFNGFEGKLAIANPSTAPFGKAAFEILKTTFGTDAMQWHLVRANGLKANLVRANLVRANLVRANNISQAFQFVDSGNAQAGFVSQSLLLQAQDLLKDEKYWHYVHISSELYPRIEQGLLVLNGDKAHPQSKAFVDYLLSDALKQQLPNFGYDIP